MQPYLMTGELTMFRDAVRRFIEKEVVPYHEQWEKDGIVPRDLWLKTGEMGFLCMNVPEEYSGGGVDDYRFNTILNEEMCRVGALGPGFIVHNELVAPYLMAYGTQAQKQKYLPPMASGELITAIAMTEPNTGSDLANVKTTALRRNGHYLVNGQKTFISNGINNDLVITVVKTDPEQGARGISLLLIERGMAGYERGRNLEKIGRHAQDTAELFFRDVEAPVENLLGKEGEGFYYLMHNLPQERLAIAISAQVGAERALEMTRQYCQERYAFGQPIGRFQNSRFKLAEMATEVEIGRVFLDHCIELQMQKQLTPEKAAMAKWWISDMQKRVVDQCLQLHGGYGYILEYPIAKLYLDQRVDPIHGGTNEIMKEIIGRSMGF